METSEVLNLAADLIEQRGWTTGNEGRDRIGDPAAPLCLEGGILAALGYSEFDATAYQSLKSCPAARAVRDYLGIRDIDSLWTWNDDYHPKTGARYRTSEQVVEVLRATAVIEAARVEVTV